MAERVGTLIIGAGIIGSSVAMQLAERGESGVVVVDPDLAGARSSSELNAGGVRATWWREVNVVMCARSIDFYRANAEEFGFKERGYLWLYGQALWDGAKAHASMQNDLGWPVELLSAETVSRRWPVIDNRDEIAGATFSPRDGLVNPNAIKQHYRAKAREGGVEFRDRRMVTDIERDGDRVMRVNLAELPDAETAYSRLTAPPDGSGAETIAPARVINTAGPWAGEIARLMGTPVHTRAVRRQISVFSSRAVDLTDLGMIVDTSGVYFHHESGPLILAGYSPPGDPPSFDFTYEGSTFFEREIWPRLASRISAMDRLEHVRGWAGLYALTPDNSAVLGAVEGLANAYEAHSFSGRGVMQSYAAGVALAELIVAGEHRTFPQADRLNSTRFARGETELEDLHI